MERILLFFGVVGVIMIPIAILAAFIEAWLD
jgi:hypothetical protein